MTTLSVAETVQQYSLTVSGSDASSVTSAESSQQVSLTVSDDNSISLTSSDSGLQYSMSVDEDIVVTVSGIDDYDGETEATPTTDTQVFETSGKRLLSDFTVNPIPSNYGLITWNGLTLTVS